MIKLKRENLRHQSIGNELSGEKLFLQNLLSDNRRKVQARTGPNKSKTLIPTDKKGERCDKVQ